jgi:putative ABC transport system permease protein
MIGRRDRWLLLRIAAQNVGRNRMRAMLLGLAVTVGVGIGFAGFVGGWALRDGMAANFARMGADLVIVPRGTLVNLTASLLTVQPTEQTLDAGLGTTIAAVPGVARVAPQRIVATRVNGQSANLIVFDPDNDVAVLTWLAEQRPGPLPRDGLIVGAGMPGRPGEALEVCGKPLLVHGRLGKTGVGPFDNSYFLSFAALSDLIAFCRSANVPAVAHGEGCDPDLPPGRVSAFLVRLAPGARINEVRFALARLPEIRIVEGNPVETASRQGLGALLLGGAVFAAFQFLALAMLVALLFSAIVRERRREVGLLRAMGARPGQIMTMILAEAALVTGLGGLAGLILGVAALLSFARSLGYYYGLLGVGFSWPPMPVLEAGALGALALAAALGLIGAVLPAWRAGHAAPHALIQSEDG